MPTLDEIEYSRDACVTAVLDYYNFLAKMFLHESSILEPPEGGWPSIISVDTDVFGKTDEVMSLLAHLPYIRNSQGGGPTGPHGFPQCYFADWQLIIQNLQNGGDRDKDDLKICSEGYDFFEHAPAHVIGLTYGGRNNQVFVLDTKLGIIHWPDCPGSIRYEPSHERVLDDPFDYAGENEEEADWRCDAPAWAIADFFELLKDQFRELSFIPTSPRTVLDADSIYGPDEEGLIPMLQDIYRQHGWPDLERYRKRECLQAVQAALVEIYPGRADGHEED
jgi:hypothetical protein